MRSTYACTVSRLVLLNGAPGSGKSTLARLYAERHPLTLALDLDLLRSMLGSWLDEPTEAGLITRSSGGGDVEADAGGVALPDAVEQVV